MTVIRLARTAMSDPPQGATGGMEEIECVEQTFMVRHRYEVSIRCEPHSLWSHSRNVLFSGEKDAKKKTEGSQ